MTKTKLLTVLSAVLLLINLFLVGWMWLHKPPHPHNLNGPKDYIVRQLGLNEEQIVRYEVLIKEHRAQQRALKDAINSTREQIYQQLLKENSNEQEVLIEKLGELKKQIECLHWNHFKDLKKICREDQQPKFEQLALELAKLMGPNLPVKPKK